LVFGLFSSLAIERRPQTFFPIDVRPAALL